MSFNYIVVGGGTAGMTVASRLTEDPDVSVLVIEAGADKSSDPAVLTPGLFATQIGHPEYDWMFQSTRQPQLNNRIIAQPRGKQLGGSSALNIMVMMYPSRENIDAWGDLGNNGWSFDELAPYYRKMATITPPGTNARDVTHVDKWYDPALDGHFGPLQIGWGKDYPEVLNGAWVETFAALGLGMTEDPRTGEAVGGFQNMESVSPETRQRSYAANAYYGPAQRARPNLTVMTSTRVVKIVTEETPSGIVAIGVVARLPTGEEKHFDASDEVVLSAGTIQSPQILELSGIGGRALLEQNGIAVKIDNPGVGEHLQDHPIVGQMFEAKDGVRSLDLLKGPAYSEAAQEQYSHGVGVLSESPLASAYAPFVDKNGVMSETQVKSLLDEHFNSATTYNHTGTQINHDKEFEILRRCMEIPGSNQVQYHLLPASLPVPDPNGNTHVVDRPQVAVMAILSHPLGRGSVHIASSSIDDAPVLDPRYLDQPLDLEILARSVQFTERIVGTPPFADALTGVRYPDYPKADESLDRAKEIVRQVTFSCYHPAGTCAMRPQEDGGVVDERLLVHGTTNLRVVDASVFPLMPSGNIQATVYAVAERAADFIKESASWRGAKSTASTDSLDGSTGGSLDEGASSSGHESSEDHVGNTGM
ncbi:Dehydrogenase citC [Apiospora arundinis]|uniref:Dehydrogenase citC n=1 Tax=Apiospora arundinis TaxID=335852 RepID=A0ABR2JI65_9PEZI